MKVKELIEILQKFPQDLTVICDRYSDYQEIAPEEITLVRAVTKVKGKDGWIMRAPTFWQFQKIHEGKHYYEEPEIIEDFVHFKGN